jgi:predicted MFS family arabinose efflux permease
MITRTVSLYKNSFTGLSRPVWFLSLVMLINRSGTMVIPFMTIYLTAIKGFTLQQAGWAMTIFGLGSVSGSYLGGYLTDRIGYYPVMFWSLLLGGVMFVAMGYMDSIWAIWITIFFLSVIAESFRPANMSAVAIYAKPENQTRSFSLMRMAANLGWSVGPATGGWLAGMYGYHTLFWADGLTCIAAGFLLWLFLQKKEGKSSRKKEVATEPVKSAYRDRTYLYFLALTTLGAIVFMQFLSTLPVFYKQDLHLTEGQIGALMAMNGLLIVLLEMPLVYTMEKKFNMLDCIGYGVLLFGFTYLVFNLAGYSVLVAIISMLAFTAGEILNMPFTNAFALSRTTDANRGQYMGLYTMTYSFAHIFAPTIGMQIAANWGFGTLWYLLSVMSVAAFAGFFIMKRKQQARVTGIGIRWRIGRIKVTL